MPGAASSSGHAKRSRATDAPRTGKDGVKRRRFSKSEGPAVNSTAPIVSRMPDEKHTTQQPLSVRVEASVQDHDQQGKPLVKQWALSSPVAGQYSNIDPVMTFNEDYLLLGTETAIHVYSVATSRRTRTLQTSSAGRIIAFRLCPENHEHLYIITSTGNVSKWDWLSGDQIFSRDTTMETSHAEFCMYQSSTSKDTLLFTSREPNNGKREIAITSLSRKDAQDTIILETCHRIDNFKVFGLGQAVIAWADQHLLLGIRTSETSNSLSFQYSWREMLLPVRPTWIDIQASGTHNQARTDGSQTHALDKMNLVLGNSDGSILVYHDFLAFIPQASSDEASIRALAPRRLHWHRGPVNVVRWSSDGNYIISGGDESVMVLWQLDTGRKQFLPHLSSPICNLVVSASGKSYILKLADNCIMLLSATELQPYATITGLQLCPKAFSSAVVSSSQPSVAFESPAAVLHPRHPDRLVVAVPASRQVLRDSYPAVNSCMLQTFDIRNSNQIHRQALARTNATTLRISPEGTEIIPPDVRHLDICQNGGWMATVDDWIPHQEDAKVLGHGNARSNSCANHRETFLKFWRWAESSSTWELVTRIDSPHSINSAPVPILDLVSRPCNDEFATLGGDAVLRLWHPINRHRGGMESKHSEIQLQSWKSRGMINLKGEVPGCELASANAACMGFSQDGSVLAICLQSESGPTSGLVALVDVQNCKLRFSRVGVYAGRPCAVRFLGRYLVILSKQSVYIWDTVDDVIRTIKSSALNGKSLLAVNPQSQTFAIVTKSLEQPTGAQKSPKYQFTVRIYDVRTLLLFSELPLNHYPASLLSDPFSEDYIVVDVAANVHRAGHPQRTSQLAVQPAGVISTSHGLGNLFDAQFHDSKRQSRRQVSTVPVVDNSSTQQPDGLPAVFSDVPPFVLPPASVLFKNVVQVFARS